MAFKIKNSNPMDYDELYAALKPPEPPKVKPKQKLHGTHNLQAKVKEYTAAGCIINKIIITRFGSDIHYVFRGMSNHYHCDCCTLT